MKWNEIVSSNENAQTTTAWMNFTYIMLGEESTQNSTYYEFIYMKFKNRPNECMALEDKTGYFWGTERERLEEDTRKASGVLMFHLLILVPVTSLCFTLHCLHISL